MKTRMILAIAALSALPTVTSAQTYPIAQFHPSLIGVPEDAQIEETVELDGDATTQEFIVANYGAWPVRRAVLQLGPKGGVCTGPFSYWFGDDPHIWPIYIRLGGLTRVFWQNRESHEWAIIGIELPACGHTERR